MTAFWLLLGGLSLIFVFISLYVDGRWNPDESQMNPAGRKLYRIWHFGLARLKVLFYVAFGTLMVFGLVLLGIENGALWFAPSSKLGYFLKYSTLVGSSGSWKTASYEQVTVSPQPHDCEWGSAPLGAKHCHYEAQVLTVRTATSTDGVTPIVSYDEGKTWNVNTDHAEPSVFISWNKVDE
jgi:hypothetical protein